MLQLLLLCRANKPATEAHDQTDVVDETDGADVVDEAEPE